ncbi:hypothetical protein DE146DRAFT_628060 [Phaeosphaeria sp. MPI-PUGE-AT-0046c]|nr:hypothetical protein DE146DRAFT_628060 [Phaeosphaeria sp. MPI-PUGE-AT-0046c]
MSANTSPCWACQSSDASSSSSKSCRVCSPTSSKKDSIKKLCNTGYSRPITSLSSTVMARICRSQKDGADTRETKSLFSLATYSPPVPQQEISTINITFSRPNSSPGVPGITLTGAANDWPTMDFDTFLDIGGRELCVSSDIRIVLSVISVRKKHRTSKSCCECNEAAWANVYFAQGMKEGGFVGSEQKS